MVEVLTGPAADPFMGRLTNAQPPRLMQQRFVDYLERQKAPPYQAKRIRFEKSWLGDLDAEFDSLWDRINKAEEEKQFTQANLIDAQRDAGGRTIAEPPGEQHDGLAAGAASLFKKSNGNGFVEARVPFAVHQLKNRLSEIVEDLNRKRGKLAAVEVKRQPLKLRERAIDKLILQGIAGTPWKFFEPAPPGKTTQRQVRERIIEFRADLNETIHAPLPAKIARQRLVQWINGRAIPINAKPLLQSILSDLDAPAAEAYIARSTVPTSGGSGAVEVENALGVVFWLFKDLIIEKCGEQIDRAARPDEALSPDDQKKKIVELKDQVLAAEMQDEAIAWELMQAGKDCELRGDADPRAILCARLDK
jgi:hypothetical protein